VIQVAFALRKIQNRKEVGLVSTLLLSNEDVRSLLDMEETVKTVERVFREAGQGATVVPAKITLDLARAGSEGWMNAMPAFLINSNAAGIKFAGGFIHNPEKEHLPYIMATIILIDPQNGAPLAIMDGYDITVDRTGAAPAVAAKYIARRPKVVGIIGVGAVGQAAINAFNVALPLEEICIYDISDQACEKAVRSIEGCTVTIAPNATACAERADVVVTATHATSPLFPKDALKRGTAVITLGSYTELDPEIVLDASCLIVDHMEQNKHRGEFSTYFKEGKLDETEIYSSLGEIIAGKKPLPNLDKGICVASLIGVASLDIAIAKNVYDRAIQQKLGTTCELFTS